MDCLFSAFHHRGTICILYKIAQPKILIDRERTVQKDTYTLMANTLRFLSVDAIENAQSGHPGLPLGMADVASVLYHDFLQFNPRDPTWANRDRLILSAGHGAMLLYACMHLTGYTDMPLSALQSFRTLYSKAAGHPEFGVAAGIETTTGPLGQGFANAVGMALAEKRRHHDFPDLVGHFTYVVAGDGCLMEGISQEALSFAGHHELGKLIVFFDDNEITIDGSTDLATSDDQLARFKASKWNVCRIDGHDHSEIYAAISAAQRSTKPTLIACKTIIGCGAPTKQGTAATHGTPLGPEEVAAMRKALDWPYLSFEVPTDAQAHWQAGVDRSKVVYSQWQDTLNGLTDKRRAAFQHSISPLLPQGWQDNFWRTVACLDLKQDQATRKSSGQVLDVLTQEIPKLMGGSADLTGSNNTKSCNTMPLTPQSTGAYIHYGVREHAMSAIMNGLALYGGFIPYGGTFLVFSDYMRPAMRLSALMRQRVIYVMTHDSIGLGADGPTHQPIEQLMSLRLIPNMHVFRPADLVETAECWVLALAHEDGPAVLSLTRQSVPAVRHDVSVNLSARGAYILKDTKNKRDMTLIATGSEVHLALDVAEKLMHKGIESVVVSMPCWALFDQQSLDYQRTILGPDGVFRASIEAGTTMGWEKYVPIPGLRFGINSFGESAPASALFKHFELTPDILCAKIAMAYFKGSEA